MIDKFSRWETQGIKKVLRKLLNFERGETKERRMGKAVSKYADATDKGDDLLWQYISQDVPRGIISYNFFHSYENSLNCSEHQFHRKGFLTERLKKSAYLFETAVNALIEWSSRFEYRNSGKDLNTSFLHKTTWELKHYDYDHHPLYPTNEFLRAIHQALIFHAKGKTDWFLNTEPVLKKSKDGAIAYFLIYSYLTNPKDYAERAYEFILQPEILFESELSDEIEDLIKGIMPYLLPDHQEAIQKIILEREKPDWETEEQPHWLFKWKYRQLSVIPSIFRLPEAQTFIEEWWNTFGLWPQPPKILGWGGTIVSPLSVSEMEGLSLNGLLRLFNFYNDETSNSGRIHPFDRSKGGIIQVANIFSECVSKNPPEYLQYMDTLWESDISKEYIYALLKGVSNHIHYRFGRLQKPDTVEFIEPLSDGEMLAETIMVWFDNYPQFLENGYEASEALHAISYVVEKDSLQYRLVDYFEKMSAHPDPEKIEQKIFSQDKTEMDESDLGHINIHSVRGRVADGVTTLIGRLLEREQEVSAKLYKLLEQFSVDPVEAVGIHVLNLLPYLEYKVPGKGWNLFKKIFQKAHPALWPYAYRFLYHQYREKFDRVYPVLEQIKNDGKKHGAESWGSISALCVLDDLISLDTLIKQLSEINNKDAWRGSVKVFTSNLNVPDLRNKCLKSLLALMETKGFPHELLDEIEFIFEQIPLSKDVLINDLVDTFIEKIPLNVDMHNLSHFFDYLSRASDAYPEWCLEKTEKYLRNYPDKRTQYMWRAEGLITTMIQLLRWADAEDNEKLINSVIKIQDRLLELEWPGIEEALSRAERE